MVRRLAATLVLVVAAGIPGACGGDGSSLGECPPGSQQQRSAGAFVVFTTCLGCHSSQLEGEARHGAPPGQDFDDVEIVRAMAADIYREAKDGTMPPPTSDVPRLSDAQIEAIRVYLACGPE